MEQGNQDTTSKGCGCVAIAIAIAVVVIILIFTFGSCNNSKSNQSNSLQDVITHAIKDAGAEKQSIDINDDVGTSQAGDKVVLIHVKGKDSLTTKLFRESMWLDSSKILKPLKGRKDIGQVTLFWSAKLQDDYGSEFDGNVMKMTLSKATLDKINFDNFDYNKFPQIADSYWEHQAMTKEKK